MCALCVAARGFHPNILRVYGHCAVGDDATAVGIVMEVCPTDLAKHLLKLTRHVDDRDVRSLHLGMCARGVMPRRWGVAVVVVAVVVAVFDNGVAVAVVVVVVVVVFGIFECVQERGMWELAGVVVVECLSGEDASHMALQVAKGLLRFHEVLSVK